MSEHPGQQGFRIAWSEAGKKSDKGDFEAVLPVIEAVCTPFAVRQFHFLGLIPAIDSHPRVLDNACGTGRQAEYLNETYIAAGKPIEITCCDIAPGMIAKVHKRIKDGHWSNVTAMVVSAEVL